MITTRQIQPDLFYIGASIRRLSSFENMMPIPRGVSFNSYLLIDEKTVLLDATDHAVGEQFLENLEDALQGRPLNYFIIHHVEPDHLTMAQAVLVRHPEVTIVCSAAASKFIEQFYHLHLENRIEIVKEGSTLTTGKHTFTFLSAQMVHWPEVLVSYESTYKILFSADAFGTFGALNGNLYADEVNFDRDWLEDARRYFTNIVGKYGTQVQTLLKKASGVDIQMICPLHGPIWRKNLAYYIQKHDTWSRYEAEEKTVLIVYGSPYGHTENAATVLANFLADKGIQNISMYDVSNTHVSYLVAEAFRCSHIVMVAPTYNNGLFPPMETFLLDLQAHQLQNRTFAIIENGTWAPVSGKIMQNIVCSMKNNLLLNPIITIKSALQKEQQKDMEILGDKIVSSMQQ